MEQLFYIFCTTLPSHIIPFVLFWNFQWRSRTAALALVTVNVLCKMATAAYCLSNGLYFRNLELAFAVVGFLIYCCFLRLSPFKMLFTYLLIVDYLLIIRGIVSVLAVQVFGIPIQGWGSSFVCILLYGVTLPLLLRFFRQVANLVYRTDAPRLWRIIWLVPAFVTVLALIFTDSYLESSVDSGFFLFCRIGLLVCVFAIYYVLLQSLEGLEQQAALRQRLVFESRLLEMQMEEEEKRSLLLMETAQQIRQMRHDLRHHLTAIQAMAGDENPRLAAYLSELIRDIPAAVRDYCENPTVNAVVSHYAARCRQEGIAFTARLTVPAQNETLDDRALCVVFANLLENGVAWTTALTGRRGRRTGNSSPASGRVCPAWALAPSGPWQRPTRETPGSRQKELRFCPRYIADCRWNIRVTRFVVSYVVLVKNTLDKLLSKSGFWKPTPSRTALPICAGTPTTAFPARTSSAPVFKPCLQTLKPGKWVRSSSRT